MFGSAEFHRPTSKADRSDHQRAVNELALDGEGGSPFGRDAAKQWPEMATNPQQVAEMREQRAALLRDAERFGEAIEELQRAAAAADLAENAAFAGRLREEAETLQKEKGL